jgi:hypothetical protein
MEDDVLEMENGEVLEDVVVEPSEPSVPTVIITTRGVWKPFEDVMSVQFTAGKTYRVKVNKECEFAISKDEPKDGEKSKEITYTASDENRLWVKTVA